MYCYLQPSCFHRLVISCQGLLTPIRCTCTSTFTCTVHGHAHSDTVVMEGIQAPTSNMLPLPISIHRTLDDSTAVGLLLKTKGRQNEGGNERENKQQRDNYMWTGGKNKNESRPLLLLSSGKRSPFNYPPTLEIC